MNHDHVPPNPGNTLDKLANTDLVENIDLLKIFLKYTIRRRLVVRSERKPSHQQLYN